MKGALSDVYLQTGFVQLMQYTLNMNFVLSFNLTIDVTSWVSVHQGFDRITSQSSVS